MVEKWYKRARKFIIEQRANELRNAVNRYPSSERFRQRKKELEELEAEMKELESD